MMLNDQMKVAEIVLDHSECAPVFQRHRIDYCCKGELPLREACAQRGVQSEQVLSDLEQAIAQRESKPDTDARALSTHDLLELIVRRHHLYLRDVLPFLVSLAKKVARVHGAHNANLLDVRDAVEELSDLLLPHLDDEERGLFPALIARTAGDADKQPLIERELEAMHADHLEVAKVLERLRNAAHDFSLPEGACTSYTTLFRELQVMEGDIFKHVHLENHVLMPRFTQS